MTNSLNIVFCITCKGRTQHLEQTLLKNLANNSGYMNCKFVVLDYGSQDHLIPFLKCFQSSIEDGYLMVYSLKTDAPFNMAHAKNMAHRCGILESADILVNLDADNFTGPDFARYIAAHYQQHPHSFLWSNMIKSGPDRTPRGISGRIAVTVNDFIKSGGYDEQFSTWSPDDKDFHLRLRRFGIEGFEIPNRFLGAVLHNDKMRFREYPHAAAPDYPETEKFEAVQSSESTVVNFGHIGCGTVYKNFGCEPIELKPLPTRIFGIGMHKTATTSLHHALKILGFDSAHWMSAHWAKACWDEMKTWGKSHTVEQHYAMCDLPFTLLYKELDKEYPGSKFILTVRNPNKWLRSVERHWNPDHNKFRHTWNHDPFTHRVHKLLYGQKGFDPDIFLRRYLQHNDEVIEYFEDRPNDLLVINMDHPTWEPLCTFLDRPIPDTEYPEEFVTP